MFHSLVSLVRQTISAFIADKCPRLGAALAFYSALSLSPLLLVVIAIAGWVFGRKAAAGEIFHQIRDLVGDQGAEVIESMLASQQKDNAGTIAALTGAVLLIVGATGLFAELLDSLNSIWNVEPTKDESTAHSIWSSVRDRLLSFALVCILALLLLVSLVFSASMHALKDYSETWFPNGTHWLALFNLLISFAMTAVMFAMIFKILPRRKPTWSTACIGAAITAVLFTIGKYLIGLYLGRMAVGTPYGAAGSFVVLLVWIYYSTQILLFGAEFTKVYSCRPGQAAYPPDPGWH